jgi:hypothetical protein
MKAIGKGYRRGYLGEELLVELLIALSLTI